MLHFARRPLLVSLFAALSSAAFAEVTVTKGEGKVTVKIDGQLFTEYHFTGARRPYLYPVIGPTGAGMTRDWPLVEGTPGEELDHVHHKGLWLGHRHVNGVGFWEDSAKPGTALGKIVHQSLEEARGGADAGVIRAKNQWLTDDGGELVANEVQTIRVVQVKEGRVLDFETTITAGAKDVVFGDDKDGFMAIRVAESMRLEKAKAKGEKTAAAGEGHIVTSAGKKDAEAWGTRAEWCDYSGPVAGKMVGVAIFDHPQNPRFPTWWHVRGYGLFAANPFGQAQFEKLADKNAGAFTIAAGQSATFRYRFYFHEGDAAQAHVAERYRAFAEQKNASGGQ